MGQIVWCDLKLENFLVFSTHGVPKVKMASVLVAGVASAVCA
jgi:hypothetical protein